MDEDWNVGAMCLTDGREIRVAEAQAERRRPRPYWRIFMICSMGRLTAPSSRPEAERPFHAAH
jgi:hypothetical protein